MLRKVLSFGETKNKASSYLCGLHEITQWLRLDRISPGCTQSHKAAHLTPLYPCSPDLPTIANVLRAAASFFLSVWVLLNVPSREWVSFE